MISVIRQIASQLESIYPAEEAEAMTWWIVEEETGFSRSQLVCGCKDTTFSAHMQKIVDRLLHFEPIQYIFGHTEWYGLDLKVTPATLIPRPETAELVERIKVKGERLKVLDIGTGTGCIAIALKKAHPEWEVTGMDISAEAIEVAKENAKRNGVEVEFVQGDIFADFIEQIFNFQSSILNSFDIIVSNPPYICEKEREAMRPNVLDFEPHTALFVPDDDPLKFYRRIASLHLGAHLFFEINEAYPMEMEEMLRDLGYTDIQLSKDIYGKARIIQARSAR